jgi:hypothetical protein
MTEKVRFFEDIKYMWDGVAYESGFDVRVCCEEGKVLVYTRRVVTETVVSEG